MSNVLAVNTDGLLLFIVDSALTIMESGDDLLEKFKRQSFGEGMLPFKGTLASLDTSFPRVYAQQGGRQRWVVSSVGIIGERY